jgi:hypothetical protein
MADQNRRYGRKARARGELSCGSYRCGLIQSVGAVVRLIGLDRKVRRPALRRLPAGNLARLFIKPCGSESPRLGWGLDTRASRGLTRCFTAGWGTGPRRSGPGPGPASRQGRRWGLRLARLGTSIGTSGLGLGHRSTTQRTVSECHQPAPGTGGRPRPIGSCPASWWNWEVGGGVVRASGRPSRLEWLGRLRELAPARHRSAPDSLHTSKAHYMRQVDPPPHLQRGDA